MVNEKMLTKEKSRRAGKTFLTEKVNDIKYAIFYCQSNSQLKLNNAIISSSKVDDNGRISFFVNRPKQFLANFDQEFPVALNYFQKGKKYFMNIIGNARMINDPEELAYYSDQLSNEKDRGEESRVLVVVTVTKFDFIDTAFERKNLLFKKIWSFISSWFNWFGTVSRSYSLGKSSAVPSYGF